MKKLFICGVSGCGKGLMKQLLDGHSKLCMIPMQGWIIKKLVSYNLKSTVYNPKLSSGYYKRILEQMPFFNIVNETSTYRIDFNEFLRNIYDNVDLYTAARSKKLWGAAGENTHTSVEFLFEYFKFEEDLFNALFSKEASVSIEEFLDVTYNLFIDNWKNKKLNRDNIKTAFTPVQNGIEPIHWLLKNTSNSKLILMDRDGIALSYVLAKHKTNRNKLSGIYSELYNYSVVNAIKAYHKVIYGKEICSNPRVLVVDFDKLVLDTNNTMRKVSDFLDIDYEEILTIATLNKIPLESEKVKFTGKINDDPLESLPPGAVELLRYLHYGPEDNERKWQQLWLGLRAFKHKYSYKYFHYRQLCKRLLELAKIRM